MSVKKIKQAIPALADRVRDTLHELDVTTTDELLPFLESEDTDVAAKACFALGYSGNKVYTRALLNIIRGDRPDLWMTSSIALCSLESKQSTRPLIKILLDSTRPTQQRYAAAYALGFSTDLLRDPHHAELIRNAFMIVMGDAKEAPTLRGLVVEGLGNMFGRCFGSGDRQSAAYHKAGTTMIAALRDAEPEVRFWAAFALGALRYRKALPALRELAGRDMGRFGNWWTVGEEASDTIDWIEGRQPALRDRSG